MGSAAEEEEVEHILSGGRDPAGPESRDRASPEEGAAWAGAWGLLKRLERRESEGGTWA